MQFPPGTAVFKCNFRQGQQCSNAIPARDSSVQMLFLPGTAVFKCYSCQGQQCSNAIPARDISVQMLFLPGTAVFKCYCCLGQQCSNAIPAMDKEQLSHTSLHPDSCIACNGQGTAEPYKPLSRQLHCIFELTAIAMLLLK